MSYIPSQAGAPTAAQIASLKSEVRSSVVAVSAATTAVGGTEYLASTATAFTITLPTSPAPGTLVTVKKLTSDANAVTVAAAASGTIDGSANFAISTQYLSVDFIADTSGTNWTLA